MRYLILALFIPFISLAQADKSWNGKKCAVVLTYDDALNVHLDNVVPALDSLNLKATFYLSGYFPGCRQRLNDWRAVAEGGHELANHTLFHPCVGDRQGREWVKPDYDLSKYTTTRLLDELRMTNVLLESLDGKKKRTFAYPCGDTLAGGKSFVDAIRNEFIAARGVKSALVKRNSINTFNVPAFGINGESGKQLIQLVKDALEQRTLVVFLFHGVGGEHDLNVSLAAHRELLKFLKENEDDVWVAPFVDVMQFSNKNRTAQ